MQLLDKKIINKIKELIWSKIVISTYKSNLYPFLYKSYWYSLFFIKSNFALGSNNYFTSKPNPGAGIGHQMANWNAGYWWAKQFGLKFAHLPFSSPEWDDLLGFGKDEVNATELIKNGYKKVLLPLFNEYNPKKINLIKKIISAYRYRKVIFITEQDQGYNEQYGIMDDLKRKFYSAEARKKDKLIYSQDNFNIAIHVRRGDITIGQTNKNTNLLLRWQNNEYFKNVLMNALSTYKTNKPIDIYLFSQGKKADFKEFEQFNNLHFCLDMNPQNSFLHLVYADLLITSKSSFSYKPALLNKGIKICPKDFWHGYPQNSDWILADENGNFDSKRLLNLCLE